MFQPESVFVSVASPCASGASSVPASATWKRSGDADVNYMITVKKPA